MVQFGAGCWHTSNLAVLAKDQEEKCEMVCTIIARFEKIVTIFGALHV